MDNEVVEILHLGIGQNDLLNALHKLRFRGLTQQGGEGLLSGLIGGVQDEQGHQHTHPTVHQHSGELTYQSGNEHSGGSDDIG